MKTCTKCGELKVIDEFPQYQGYHEKRCKKCKRAYTKAWRLSNMDSSRTACRKYHSSTRGRALMMLLGMKKRSRKEGWIVPEFTVEDIAAVLDGGRCAQTGIQFDLERTEHSHNNPFAPSPDRIDSSRGYTKDNVQFVCWMYNAMKSDFPQSAVTQFIGALVNKYTPAYNPPLAQDTFRGLLGKPWGPHSFRWRHTMFIDGMELLVEWSCRRDCYVTQFSEGHAVYWQYVGETYPTDSEIVVAAGYAKPELTLINNRLKRDTQ